MSDFLKLAVGALVEFESETWRIIHIEDFERALATRTSDGRHDFLPISRLKTLTPNQKKAETASLLEESESSDAKANSPKLRRIRSSPNDTTQQSDALKKQLNDNLEEFDFAQKILSLPRLERRHLIHEMCEKFNYSEKTAYRRLKIVRTYNNSDALLHSESPRDSRRLFGLSQATTSVF